MATTVVIIHQLNWVYRNLSIQFLIYYTMNSPVNIQFIKSITYTLTSIQDKLAMPSNIEYVILSKLNGCPEQSTCWMKLHIYTVVRSIHTKHSVGVLHGANGMQLVSSFDTQRNLFSGDKGRCDKECSLLRHWHKRNNIFLSQNIDFVYFGW